MQILSEQERVVVDMECEWESDELDKLILYAETHMSDEEYQSMMVSWAVTDILRKQLAAFESGEAEQLNLFEGSDHE